ncbi:hypothetical protein IFU08_02235 [Microbacterium sp. CFBP 8790]|uniref:DUF6153 family protein n=1 Tax=unclassified Microbacterium TaxID=2609290 RepID=UPI00177D42F9|nr:MULTISPECIES: DUF6153 family protein [unclassified Microbacterium]MBD8206420.1 hypothetical protein [Microbacterium sp. CFBP 8801]MBD8508384.1 hypothetical protein [Microbacterium sp. CFBP 8790]
MSLVGVAEYARGPRALAHVILLTVAIVAGLLAMHAFHATSTPAGHGAATGHSTAVMASPSEDERPHDAMTASVTDGAASSVDHSMAWMACVLALLGAVIVFVAGVGLRLPGARARLLSAVLARWSVVAHALPPPSLTVLCIRRT